MGDGAGATTQSRQGWSQKEKGEVREGENWDPGKKIMHKCKISGAFAAKRYLLSATM